MRLERQARATSQVLYMPCFFKNWNLAHFMYQISTGILIFQEPSDF